MMEIFVRIALKKYYNPETPNSSILDSIKLFFNEHLIPYMSQIDSHSFCANELWNEECDYIFKDYYPALENLYNLYSGRYSLPGSPKYVSLEEFIAMLVNGRVISE